MGLKELMDIPSSILVIGARMVHTVLMHYSITKSQIVGLQAAMEEMEKKGSQEGMENVVWRVKIQAISIFMPTNLLIVKLVS